MYIPFTYKAEVTRVVDGDTIDVELDLGFSILMRARVRLLGIDTPESRTRDLVEKKFGLAAKDYLKHWIEEQEYVMIESTEKGKFGRVLGNVWNPECNVCINTKMIEDHHAVEYTGQNKEDVQEAHMINRNTLTSESLVL
jgi:micrococcal nuclease